MTIRKITTLNMRLASNCCFSVSNFEIPVSSLKQKNSGTIADNHIIFRCYFSHLATHRHLPIIVVDLRVPA